MRIVYANIYIQYMHLGLKLFVLFLERYTPRY